MPGPVLSPSRRREPNPLTFRERGRSRVGYGQYTSRNLLVWGCSLPDRPRVYQYGVGRGNGSVGPVPLFWELRPPVHRSRGRGCPSSTSVQVCVPVSPTTPNSRSVVGSGRRCIYVCGTGRLLPRATLWLTKSDSRVRVFTPTQVVPRICP